MENIEAFEKICGDCEGLNIDEITENDVRNQAKIWRDSGEKCSKEMEEKALAGLKEYQEN